MRRFSNKMKKKPNQSRKTTHVKGVSKVWVVAFPVKVGKGNTICVVFNDAGETPYWPDKQSALRGIQRIGLGGNSAIPVLVRRESLTCPTPWVNTMQFDAAKREIAEYAVQSR